MKFTFIDRRSIKAKVTFSTLAIFVLSIWLLTLFAGRMLQNDMQRQLGEQQFSTVSIVAADIDAELDDRMRALERVAALITPAMLRNAAAMQTFIEVNPALLMMFNAGVFVILHDGTAIADVPLSTGRRGKNFMERIYAIGALKEGKTTIGSPVMGKALLSTIFSIAAPIHNAQGKVIGALTGTVDLARPNFLDRITDNSYGKTGGYLLIAPQYKLIVTGTDKSRIMKPTPAPGVNPLFDRYVQGFQGYGRSVNSLGVEELTAAKQIPIAGWFVIVKIPVAEAFAPIYVMQQRMLCAAFILTLLAGGLTWWMLRRQLAPMLATVKTLAALPGSNQPMLPLPITRQNEIGELIGGFNRLLAALGERGEALKKSEKYLRELQLVAGLGTYALDLTTGHWVSSDVLDDIFGINKNFDRSVAGWVSLFHPDDHQMMVDYFTNEVVGKLQRFDKEYRIINHRDGKGRWLHGLGRLELNAEGQPVRMIGTIQDITERKQADAMLKESHERLLTVLSGLEAIVYVADMKTHELLFVNNYVKGIFGDVVGQLCWKSIQTGQSGQCAFCTNDKLLDTYGKPAGIYHWEFQNSINARWYDIRDRAIQWVDGRIVRLEIATDITERKRAEEQNLRSLREKEVLLKEVHHRVKNNMQVMCSLLNLQAKGIADEAIRAMFEEARNRVMSMALVHEQLYGSKDLAHIDFKPYLQSLIAGIADTYKLRDVVYSVVMEPIALDVNKGIPCGLIVNELVSNCLKYAFPDGRKGTIKVGISKDSEGNNVLTVSDNGVGFPEDIDFRNTSSLGLQLVNVLTGQIHGTIELTKEEGTTFRITFPGENSITNK